MTKTKKNPPSSHHRPTAISFFSGIGGLDIGFHKAGFDIVACVEIKHDCCETHRANAGRYSSTHPQIIEGDITKLQPKDIYKGRPDFIIGGPPCQAFSAIGRRAGGAMGTLDARGNLFKHYCRLLKAFRPAGFLFENVRGILSSHGGDDWRKILAAFSRLGYTLKFRVLDAADYGVAQHRERLILVGYKKGRFQFPRPTHGPDAVPPSGYMTPQKILSGLSINTAPLWPKGGKYDHLLKDIPPGMNYLYYTREMGHPSPCFAWRSKFSDFLYKADPLKPVKTIVARLGSYSGPFHWEGRRLHVSEFKRLQGIPDDYVISGGETAQLRQIGDSVAPPFAYNLALAVKRSIFNFSENVALLPDNATLSFDKRKARKAKRTRNLALAQGSDGSTQLDFFSNGSATTEPGPRNRDHAYPPVVLGNASNHEFSINGWELLEQRSDKTIFLTLSRVGSRKSKESIEIEVLFARGVIAGIDKVVAKMATIEPKELYVLWEAVNHVIATNSSYPSIHELYGHFTEPNPAFTLQSRCTLKKPWAPEISLMMWFSDFQRVQKLFPLDFTAQLGFSKRKDATSWVREMRSLRFDIRTHSTNQTIPLGMFRCCYPFTLPLNRRSFVTITP